MIIGFYSGAWSKTLHNFETFIEANKENVKKFTKTRGYAELDDDITIQCISNHRNDTLNKEYDYLILSDTKDFTVVETVRTLNIKFSNNVPLEYRLIKDIVEN